jgi:hypothetical protein
LSLVRREDGVRRETEREQRWYGDEPAAAANGVDQTREKRGSCEQRHGGQRERHRGSSNTRAPLIKLRRVLDFRPATRALFIIAYLALQLSLIVTADLRPDRVFGFRMFNESSSLKFDLYRKVRRRGRERIVPVAEGSWEARSRTGEQRRFEWAERVHYGALTRPGEFVHATYGLDAQLFRLQRALEDVVAHIPDDEETVALVAEVETLKNGRSGEHRTLEARRP